LKQRIVIAGFGRTGRHLASRLSREWDVSAVDLDPACAGGAAALTTGDATSALVLERAGMGEARAAAACTSSDEVNLEFLSLARERFGVLHLFALMRDPANEPRYKGLGAQAVERAESSARALSQRVPSTHAVPIGVGLGRGEVVEVEVLPGSGVLGKPLSTLHPRSWLVAAVYRGEQIIVPHGDTLLEPGDRVLLAGDPEIIPSIAGLIRGGESEFPLQHGTNVVMFCHPAWERNIGEFAYLVGHTKAKGLDAISCRADERSVQALVAECADRGIPCESTCDAGDSRVTLIAEVGRRDVGILVLPDDPIGVLASLGIRRARIARIVSLLDSPVVVSRGTFPYARILLVVSGHGFSHAAIRVAVDAARVFGAQLHVALVHEPEMVVGTDARKEVESRGREVDRIAEIYRLPLVRHVLEGNIVRAVVPLTDRFDLVVVPYRARRRAILVRPDAEANLIHRCKCSVMIVPA